METDPELEAEPANLRFLRRLVTVLTATMIVGLLVLITLIVIRLQSAGPTIALPDEITLPDGSKTSAFTQGAHWYAVVTQDDQILIFDRESGELRQQIVIKTSP